MIAREARRVVSSSPHPQRLSALAPSQTAPIGKEDAGAHAAPRPSGEDDEGGWVCPQRRRTSSIASPGDGEESGDANPSLVMDACRLEAQRCF